MYLLGFDYGHKNIGVALGQMVTRTASPKTTLHLKDGPPWQNIQTIVEEYKPITLVVGLPLGRDGEEQAMTKAARQFARTLEKKFAKQYQLGVVYQDERYTSQAAEQIYAKAKGKHKSGWDRDSIAAMLILEAWLDNQTPSQF